MVGFKPRLGEPPTRSNTDPNQQMKKGDGMEQISGDTSFFLNAHTHIFLSDPYPYVPMPIIAKIIDVDNSNGDGKSMGYSVPSGSLGVGGALVVVAFGATTSILSSSPGGLENSAVRWNESCCCPMFLETTPNRWWHPGTAKEDTHEKKNKSKFAEVAKAFMVYLKSAKKRRVVVAVPVGKRSGEIILWSKRWKDLCLVPHGIIGTWSIETVRGLDRITDPDDSIIHSYVCLPTVLNLLLRQSCWYS